jgi:serine/threonine protein kinase
MTKKNSDNYGILDEKYILECEMGDGATSTVYKAKDSLSGKYYAVKLFKNPSKIFFREVLFNQRILKSKDNSHFFVKYISSSLNGSLDVDGFKETKCYILYELAPKGDLFKYIKCYGNGFNDKYSKVITYKILKSLKTLHKLKICHRDIKADNILLDEKYNIKIADFGLSGFTYGNNGKILQKERVGTEQYMAPEVIEKKEYDGEKADIFSTGVLIFNILTGKIPFPIAKVYNEGSKIKLLYRFIKEKDEKNYWETLKEEGIDGLSPEFKDLFLKMVAFEPSERPTIKEILNHDWMKEVSNLNEEEFKQYEEDLISELKEREENF